MKDYTLLTYDFPLRPDLLIRIELPSNLTEAEAARLAAFLRSLVVETVERTDVPPA